MTRLGFASLNKPIFAYVVLRLAERGAIDLDRPLAELLDDPRVTHDERGGRITPRMVLSHGTVAPLHQGDLRPADGLHLPVHAGEIARHGGRSRFVSWLEARDAPACTRGAAVER